MLLKTFLSKLEYTPVNIRHDNYEQKDIIIFKKVDGYFPYVEFQSIPKDKQQQIYFDILNWEFDPKEKYVTKLPQTSTGFMQLYSLSNDNQLSTIDSINDRLHVFYMLFKDRSSL